MKHAIHTFTVTPKLPQRLSCLRDIAYNLYWSWNNDIVELFRRLDADLWDETGHNPALMLGLIGQERLEEVARHDAFLAHMDRVRESLESYMKAASWYDKQSRQNNLCIAYFSAEYGITECLPFYSGGLGVLAGDHLKSASDLGLPLVGVGLLYQEGYFNQYLDSDGWQQESYPENDFYNMPIQPERDNAGNPLKIEVEYPEGPVFSQIWRAQMGRVPLYLLDTNIPDNKNPEDRDITDRLYGGDQEYRIRQEIMLGIGGLRALDVLGIQPTVYHMNEGHSAFLIFERIRRLMLERNLNFEDAFEMTLASNVFTTHTSVPAGIDIFADKMLDKYFSNYCTELGISKDVLLSLGKRSPESHDFCMASLALRSSEFSNGVSTIHGEISRNLWKAMWPEVPQHEIPIASNTNGVHISSWISKDMGPLFNRYLGPKWAEDPLDKEVWDRIDEIPDVELWRNHQRRRERLVAYARQSLRTRLERRGASRSEIEGSKEVLNPSALTIGFARRFAAYKRADLILKNSDRLARILSNTERPVQIIFAGKAHPQDEEAKDILRKLIHLLRQEPFRSRIVFIENYSMSVARYIVQGSDLWLNTPRRLNEACGTSGMKAAANGVINMSILDGWWDEAHGTDIGWAIGHREMYEDFDYQDKVESNMIYEMLEKEIVPTFYERGSDNLPRRWIALMKASMRSICPVFYANRMVCEYYQRFYQPCAQLANNLSAGNFARAKRLALWKSHMREKWQQVIINTVESDSDPVEVGSKLRVRAEVYLGSFEPKDVSVQIYSGRVDSKGEIVSGQGIEMENVEPKGGGAYLFQGAVPCRSSGQHGYSVRVLPKHEDLNNPFIMNLITWVF
ncbi:MAG: alpha-glucan family phosphorylase [Gemmatimonadota bacterium]|nr:MAG: alpha-glucan family phosphorylase [Gemmatimonadota bacterium]